MKPKELAQTALDKGLEFYPKLQALIYHEDLDKNITAISTPDFPPELKDRTMNIFNYEKEPNNYNQPEVFIYETDTKGRFVITTKAEDAYLAKEASSIMFVSFNRKLHFKD